MNPHRDISAEERERLDRALVEGIVVETSGSTAAPKRVALSASALRASTAATASAIGVGGWVLALPLTYVAGIMVGIRACVADQPLVDLRAEAFDATQFASAVNQLGDGIWFTSLVPTQLSRLVDVAESDDTAAHALRRFDTILVGGQAIPAELVERARALGAHIVRTYGSAETAGGVVYDGYPIGDTRLRIADDGVLEISSSSLADGYQGDDERTARHFSDGWFRTSDFARIEDGRLVIEGRVDDIIMTGGIKVSLADIERILAAAGISAVASWYFDDEWGQVPALVSTAELDYDGVRNLIEAELGKAARPYRIVRTEAVPMLANGKPDRLAVREIVQSQQP